MRASFSTWALGSTLVLCMAAGCGDSDTASDSHGDSASTQTGGAGQGGTATSGGSGGTGNATGDAGSGAGGVAGNGSSAGASGSGASGGVGGSGGTGGGGAGGSGGESGAGGTGATSGSGGTAGSGGTGPLPDVTPPVVTLGGTSNGALLRTARLNVSVHAEDAGTLAKVEFALNGAAFVALDMSGGQTMFDGAVDVRPTRGANSLVVAAEDLAGNRTEVPLAATFARKLGAGGSHTGAINASGHVAVWGRNNLGQLGLGVGDATSRFEPVPIAGLEQITAIDFRQNQSLALRQDGALFVWGNNADGRLGLGAPGMPDMEKREAPAQNMSLTGVLAATFGYDHTLVLLEDGTIRAFGDNSSGQLGDGTIEDRHYPVPVMGLDDIIQIAGGSKHSLALRRDGTVWAWGRNQYGHLGQGSEDTDPHPLPVQVPGLTDIIHLASGRDHVLALRADGTAVAWGLNQNGQVGNAMSGADSDVFSPTAVVGLMNAVAVFADGNYSFALRADASAAGWGQNFNGQLGIGGDDTVDRNAPDAPLALPAVLDIDPGATHSIGVAPDGSAYTWGWSTNGSLGRPNLLNNWAYPTPALVTLP